MGDHSTSQEIDSSLAKLGDNPLLLGDLQRAPSPARSAVADHPPEKKERKKRQHDPNAPKRPLTPFFLYMQTARPIITEDLGPEVLSAMKAREDGVLWSRMTSRFVLSPNSPPYVLIHVALDQCLQGQLAPLQRKNALVQIREKYGC